MESITQEHAATPAPARSEPVHSSQPAPTPKTGGLMERLAQWSIERRVLAGFGLVFSGIVVISAISYRNTAVLIENSRLDTKSHELVQLLGSVGEALDAAESGHRRYLVTGDESYLTSYRTVVEQMPEYRQYLRGLTNERPEQQDLVAELEQLITRQLGEEAEAITRREKDGYEAVRHLALSGAAKSELEQIHRLMAELDAAEQRAYLLRVAESAGSTKNTIALLGLGAFLQLALLAFVYYLIHHDVTERRRVASELQNRGELLQAANKELEAFSYSVSHDLRAPLRHIDGYAALLSKAADEALSEKARRYLQTISDSAKHMGQLIDDLLVFHVVIGKTVNDISLNAVANLGYAQCKFGAPVYAGDTLSTRSTVIGLRENASRESGIVYVRSIGRNQRDDVVLDYVRWVMVRKRDQAWPSPDALVPELAGTVAPVSTSPVSTSWHVRLASW